jgi:hypothetical protein
MNPDLKKKESDLIEKIADCEKRKADLQGYRSGFEKAIG